MKPLSREKKKIVIPSHIGEGSAAGPVVVDLATAIHYPDGNPYFRTRGLILKTIHDAGVIGISWRELEEMISENNPHFAPGSSVDSLIWAYIDMGWIETVDIEGEKYLKARFEIVLDSDTKVSNQIR